jgi:hypothetical protein
MTTKVFDIRTESYHQTLQLMVSHMAGIREAAHSAASPSAVQLAALTVEASERHVFYGIAPAQGGRHKFTMDQEWRTSLVRDGPRSKHHDQLDRAKVAAVFALIARSASMGLMPGRNLRTVFVVEPYQWQRGRAIAYVRDVERVVIFDGERAHLYVGTLVPTIDGSVAVTSHIYDCKVSAPPPPTAMARTQLFEMARTKFTAVFNEIFRDFAHSDKGATPEPFQRVVIEASSPGEVQHFHGLAHMPHAVTAFLATRAAADLALPLATDRSEDHRKFALSELHSEAPFTPFDDWFLALFVTQANPQVAWNVLSDTAGWHSTVTTVAQVTDDLIQRVNLALGESPLLLEKMQTALKHENQQLRNALQHAA